MLGEEDEVRPARAGRKQFLRSVSWTDRSPSKPVPKPQPNSKGRSGLPPLSITRRPVEEWPRAGSDDLGVWPNPQTPRGPSRTLEASGVDREFQLKKDKLAFFDKECSRIAEHVYLGSDAVAKNREILRKSGITHVLNCVGFVCPEYFKSDLVYKTLWLQDSPSEDITSILYDVFDYFEDVREHGGRVLVHCCQGISRSTSLVIAYLMWSNGQSFEDAFQYVKAARGVTNPNMGFACQLLQCQKRVHAMPASPNSALRMYRMAPHSSYDPLHLVPKMLGHPGKEGLDSRGAFVVHIPTAIYVWIGKKCDSVMSDSAIVAANQVIRYERARGPLITVREGEEPLEFWDALAGGQLMENGCDEMEVKKVNNLLVENDQIAAEDQLNVGERTVNEYDFDFELFRKALAGGVVPPFSISNAESETCLPARENGWHRLRQKFASGIMKEFVNSSKFSCDMTPAGKKSDMNINALKEENASLNDISSPSSYHCGSPSASDCSLNSLRHQIKDGCGGVEPVALNNPSYPTSPCGSPDSFSCFAASSPKFSSKSPTLSPSTSDYASSFSFSPSSSNWSDLSYLSSWQPSPSSLEVPDPFSGKNTSLMDYTCKQYDETPPSPTGSFSVNRTLRTENTCLQYKGTSRSIAERRGSNPPPRMSLPSIDEPSKAPRYLLRSNSFSLPDLDDEIMEDVEYNQLDHENDSEPMLDFGISGNESRSETENNRKYDGFHPEMGDIVNKVPQATTSVLYEWPTLNKVEMFSSHVLDSRLAYMLFTPDVKLGIGNVGVLYIRLGHDINGGGAGQLINAGSTCKESLFQWDTIGRNFLNQVGLPANASILIFREGDEPEDFLLHLRHFLVSKG